VGEVLNPLDDSGCSEANRGVRSGQLVELGSARIDVCTSDEPSLCADEPGKNIDLLLVSRRHIIWRDGGRKESGEPPTRPGEWPTCLACKSAGSSAIRSELRCEGETHDTKNAIHDRPRSNRHPPPTFGVPPDLGNDRTVTRRCLRVHPRGGAVERVAVHRPSPRCAHETRPCPSPRGNEAGTRRAFRQREGGAP
jgi:hypothetical protein